MKTNCKEVLTDNENTWSVLEDIDFYTAETLIKQGNKNVVANYDDSGIHASVLDVDELISFDNDGFGFSLIRYYESQ